MSNVKYVELSYPRVSDVDTIQIELCCVRAADDIQIKYDHDRDGWVILQASTFEWLAGETKFDMDWQEVVFIQAWAREKSVVPEEVD